MMKISNAKDLKNIIFNDDGSIVNSDNTKLEETTETEDYISNQLKHKNKIISIND